MSLSAGILDALLANGATKEMIVAAVKADIAEREAEEAAKKERKKAGNRERQQRKRNADRNGESRVTSVTERDGRDPAPKDNNIQTPTQKISEPNGSSPKSGICFPADWVVPPVSELTPKARACAAQWTSASYETEAEGFALYWQQSRKRRPDWKATWCAWVIRQHSKIMRDQKFGNAPRDGPKELSAQELREQAEWFVRHGMPDRANDCRRKAIAIENRIAA